MEISNEVLHVDLSPVRKFRYVEISNHYFQFILLGENNQALHTPFQCKDYLQDIFFAEATGIVTDAYGIRWKKGMLNTDTGTFRMALHGGSILLESIAPAFQMFLNIFEEALGFSPTVVTTTDKPEIIVVDFSKEWTENGPLLSAYTTLIRLAGMYNGGDALEYLRAIHEYKNPDNRPAGFPMYMSKEIARLDKTLNRLAALLQGKKPDDAWSNHADTTNIIRDVHDMGICNFPGFPTVDLSEKGTENV